MPPFILQAWPRLLNLLLRRIVLVLALMFCIAVGIALSNMSRLSSSLIESQAVQGAALYTQSFAQATDLYSDAAVDRAKTVPGVTVTHAYLNQNGAIPLPSTFAIELGDRISEHNKDISVRFYSDHPFPWRQGGAKDAFEREALVALRRNPNQPFYRLEEQGNMFRYGQAVIMKPTCVACHNTDPNSPKRDWEVGDVGGVWEISQPLNTLVERIEDNLKGTVIMFGGIAVMGISGLTLVVGKLRQTARELEHRVKERTNDLAHANTDLEKRNQLIRQIFGRYLSDTVVNNLLDSPEGLRLGGDRRKITILTSDLRGFSALSERLQPEEVIRILNLYLEYMADVINRYEGTIDEFMGDGILVLFGAPMSTNDDAARAIACAIAMQLAMGSVNERMRELGLPQLEMGIGIHTGEVVVGNIGSEKRSKYGIVGSPVNLTYRIESYTRGGQILISDETLREAGSRVKVTAQKQVQPKGFQQPITLHDIYGIGGFYNLYLPRDEELFLPLPQPIALRYTILEGKQINNLYIQGSLVQLSSKGAEIRVLDSAPEHVPSELANLKLNLLSLGGVQPSEDLYAKVTSLAGRVFWVRFTMVPLEVQAQLDRLYTSLMPTRSSESPG